ncbi:ribonuclease P protein component [Thermogemmatispora sp.]|uniref:ribonuclease P protein component n=1 Tax=Thermogemmatispora sp. TaxID=1968838 RepID=UPI001D8EDA48|nr:ribonuclease P protein component [Thermogemmatispora sp.]MBX5450356.1 ribonuclease P protein component [Thermogemmatispora sp.]
MALKRELRLRRSRDFQRVRQQGRSVASKLLVLAWAPTESDQVRVGFVVSRRIFKLATRRNRIKRLLSEAIRPCLPRLRGVDIVLIPRREALEVDLQTLRADVQTLLRRARLLLTDEAFGRQRAAGRSVHKGR